VKIRNTWFTVYQDRFKNIKHIRIGFISNYFPEVQKNDFLEIVASTPMVSGCINTEALELACFISPQRVDKRCPLMPSLNPKRGGKKTHAS
jgi:hypothetical protein